MTCYHPIRAIVIGSKDNGKKNIKIVGKEYDNTFAGKQVYEEVMLPCGKCIGCRIEKSKDWANRLMLELMDHDKACFITLTYNDDNLPESHYIDDDGVLHTSHTLVKKHFQDFMKRLRKRFQPIEIRFYACGEYGSKTKRPHYHAILYGIDFSEDRFIHNITKEGYIQYRSPTLEKCWKFGFSMINEVNWQTCAYVARYVTKKFYGKQNIYYQTFNIVPEFSLMSRRPGIGRKYYDEHKDEIYRNQEIFISDAKGGKKVMPPKYFDRLFEEERPEVMEQIKSNRMRMAILAKELKLKKTSLDYYDLLKVEEENFLRRISSLKREKV